MPSQQEQVDCGRLPQQETGTKSDGHYFPYLSCFHQYPTTIVNLFPSLPARIVRISTHFDRFGDLKKASGCHLCSSMAPSRQVHVLLAASRLHGFCERNCEGKRNGCCLKIGYPWNKWIIITVPITKLFVRYTAIFKHTQLLQHIFVLIRKWFLKSIWWSWPFFLCTTRANVLVWEFETWPSNGLWRCATCRSLV